MNLITKEMLSDLLNVAKTSAEFLSDQAVDVVNQALNYALYEAVIALVSTLSLYAIYYIIAKLLVGAEEANKIENTEKGLKTANAIKTLRTILLVIFTGVIFHRSVDTIKMIGKITISPKVYLLEEGAKVLEKLKSKQEGK